MAVAFDGTQVPRSIKAPCGETAYFETDAGHGYRCGTCFAVIGSMGMPRECVDLLAAARIQDFDALSPDTGEQSQ